MQVWKIARDKSPPATSCVWRRLADDQPISFVIVSLLLTSCPLTSSSRLSYPWVSRKYQTATVATPAPSSDAPPTAIRTYPLMGQQNQRFIRRNLQPHVQQQQQPQHHSIYDQTQNQHRRQGPIQDRSRSQVESDMNRHINTTVPASEKLDISDVRDPSDINQLTAKQLKIILTRNCVDFRGIFEKEVLREKVLQLWIDCNEKRTNPSQGNDGSQEKSNDIDEKFACKICMEREINCVLLECGHMLTCIPCGRKLAECPICRQNITRCVRTFRG